MTEFSGPTVSGLFPIDANPLKRKKVKFFGFIYYRNHEIACPECGEMVKTMRISVMRAEWGVKMFCDWCKHQFIYHYEERRA